MPITVTKRTETELLVTGGVDEDGTHVYVDGVLEPGDDLYGHPYSWWKRKAESGESSSATVPDEELEK